MKRIDYAQMDQTLYTDTLSNGLTVRVLYMPGYTKKYAFFATKYGAVDTSFMAGGKTYRSADGVAHYLEHKAFDTEDGHALQKMSSNGASPNAFTSYDITAYFFECTEGFEENLKTLLSFVSVPYYTQETVDKERGIIAQEIKMYEDSPDSRLGENLFRAMYLNHPLKVNIAGTVESISEITPEMLYTCHHAFYDPSNMVLCVAGEVDPEEVIRCAKEILPEMPGAKVTRDYGPEEPLAPASNYIEQAMEVSMPMFAIGIKLPYIPDGIDRLRLEILGGLTAEVLCGESSALYQKLYEEGMIDSGFGAGFEQLRGMASLNFSGDSDSPQTVLQAILSEAKRISNEGVDEALFQRLKKAAMGHHIRGLDSFNGMCYRLAVSCFDGYDYFCFPDLYESVTPEDIRQFISRNVREEQAVLSVICPVNKEV